MELFGTQIPTRSYDSHARLSLLGGGEVSITNGSDGLLLAWPPNVEPWMVTRLQRSFLNESTRLNLGFNAAFDEEEKKLRVVGPARLINAKQNDLQGTLLSGFVVASRQEFVSGYDKTLPERLRAALGLRVLPDRFYNGFH